MSDDERDLSEVQHLVDEVNVLLDASLAEAHHRPLLPEYSSYFHGDISHEGEWSSSSSSFSSSSSSWGESDREEDDREKRTPLHSSIGGLVEALSLTSLEAERARHTAAMAKIASYGKEIDALVKAVERTNRLLDLTPTQPTQAGAKPRTPLRGTPIE